MQVDLDRTQEWLNRTQAIRRTPAVRGGVAADHTSLRQTAAFVLGGLLVMLILLLIPRPSHEQQKRLVVAALPPAVTDLATRVELLPLRPLPLQPLGITRTPSQWSSQVVDQQG